MTCGLSVFFVLGLSVLMESNGEFPLQSGDRFDSNLEAVQLSTDPALKNPSYHQTQETSDNVFFFNSTYLRKGFSVGKSLLIHSILCF